MSALAIILATVGPFAGLVLGFGLRHLFAGKSSPPVVLSDADRKAIAMAVYAEVQPVLDALTAAVGELPAKVAAAVAAGGDPNAAADKADTIAAVETAAQGAVDAINAVGAPT